jgi:hypothetical protein
VEERKLLFTQYETFRLDLKSYTRQIPGPRLYHEGTVTFIPKLWDIPPPPSLHEVATELVASLSTFAKDLESCPSKDHEYNVATASILRPLISLFSSAVENKAEHDVGLKVFADIFDLLEAVGTARVPGGMDIPSDSFWRDWHYYKTRLLHPQYQNENW